MYRNFFRTAWRNLLRNKNYTLINFSGLAVGITVCLIIFIIIQFELSFDNFHSKKDRIYRVLTEYHHADAPDIFYGRGVPPALPLALEHEFPEVQRVAPVYTQYNDQILVLDDKGQTAKKFKEERGVFFLTPSFFSIFDFAWLAGSAASLKERNTAVLSKETAEKYFGDWKKAPGHYIKWNNTDLLRVTGVLATIPSNTDFQLKIVISYGTGATGDFLKSQQWDNTGESFGCYVLLMPNTSEAFFNTKLRAVSKKHKSAGNQDSHIIQSLSRVHYDNRISNYLGKTISPQLIRTLWLIAIFILIIACVNFVNLATAQAVNRAKEVGVRKALGSNKIQLRAQFLIETFIIVAGALACATLLTLWVLPSVGRLLDMPLGFSPARNPYLILFLVLILVSVTALAGFYPSIVLSGFNATEALKSKIKVSSQKGISLRKGLVVFQFVIAQALIIGTLIIVKQMNYFTHASMGFDKDAIVNISFPGDSAGVGKIDYLRKTLSDISGIRQVSFSSNTPSGEDNNWSTFTFDHAAKQTDFYAITKFSDADYLNAYQLKLIAGKNLDPSDTIKEFLVNESVVKKLGLSPQEALNKEILLWDHFKGPIVGVLKDYHDRTFRNDDAPLIMTSFKKGYCLANIKLQPAEIAATLPAIEKVWNNVFPDYAFEYQFLDDRIAGFYKQENQLAGLYKIFASLAIFLSCLGLYGLASFMAAQRIKEIGIRKVLGATAGNILYLFSKEFLVLIAIAFLIATPLAWYFMHQWIQDYVYRTPISLWIFLLGGTASILIALLTVGFRAMKAALSNPVNSLRTE
jgi:putative ABC transport system permease protein